MTTTKTTNTKTTNTMDPSAKGHEVRNRVRAASLATGLLLLGAAGLGISALAGAVTEPTREVVTEPSTWHATYASCMLNSAGTADSMERYVGLCAEKASALWTSSDMVLCMGTVADVAERRADACAERFLPEAE